MDWHKVSDNVEPLSYHAIAGLHDAMLILKQSWVPPHDCVMLVGPYEFRVDPNMNTDNGVMGYTKFFSNTIYISRDVEVGLTWQGNNEVAMSTVIHELTHRAQMLWCGGWLWPILQFPGLRDLTLEKWANENGRSAGLELEKAYMEMRRTF